MVCVKTSRLKDILGRQINMGSDLNLSSRMSL